MDKLRFLPNQDGYSVSLADGNIEVELDGGKPFIRNDMLDKWHNVSATWQLTGQEYQVFLAFYRLFLKRGSQPFLIDLITDGLLIEHTAQFRAGSVALDEQSGDTYYLSAELSVKPVKRDKADDLAIYISYLDILNPLEQLVNVDLDTNG